MKTTDLHDTLKRARECAAETLEWITQAQGEIPDPPPVDECGVLEAAAEILTAHQRYNLAHSINEVRKGILAQAMLAGMHAATARKEGATP